MVARFGRWQAHPRVGGENLITSGNYDGNLGSSPRRRGKLLRIASDRGASRLIPA